MKQCILTCALLFAGACAIFVVLFANVRTTKNTLWNLNIEALTQAEQPDANECIKDPDYECWALHPTDPSLDIIRRGYRW